MPGDPQTDYGTDPSENLKYMESSGILGHVYKAGGAIDVRSTDHLRWGMHIFGGLRFCINCPDFADDAFDQGIWDYSGQTYRLEGGHDIRGVAYEMVDGEPLWEIITWGKRIRMTQAFWEEFGTLAEADLSPDLITAAGTAPTGLDLGTMIADLDFCEQ